MYTYGYCVQDGKRGSRAAYGIHVSGYTPITDRQGNYGTLTLNRYHKQSRRVASLLAVEKVLDTVRSRSPPALAVQRTLQRAHRDPTTRIVIHCDLQETVEACTALGEKLHTLGFPGQTNVQYIRRLYPKALAVLGDSRPGHSLSLVLSEHATRRRDHQGTRCARQLAKTVLEEAVHGSEKRMFVVNSGSTFDDDTRAFLNVPPHEHAYARQKGAWWDHESQRFYLYSERTESPSTYDVGAFYDMRPTDYVNLWGLFGRAGAR